MMGGLDFVQPVGLIYFKFFLQKAMENLQVLYKRTSSIEADQVAEDIDEVVMDSGSKSRVRDGFEYHLPGSGRVPKN